MLSIYRLKSSYWEKVTYSESLIGIWKVRIQVSFWGGPTEEDIIKYWSFLLQLKNERSGGKTMSG